MRKLLFLAIGMVMTGGLVLAQTHSNATERKVTVELTLAQDMRVGTTMLKADDYIISCDGEKLMFVRKTDRTKVLEIKCEGTELTKKSDDTRTYTTVDRSGVVVLQSLVLKGSNIKHTLN